MSGSREPGAGSRSSREPSGSRLPAPGSRSEPILILPPSPRALYVLAHGAGAGMRHPFLATMAQLLAERGIGTLRYEFPYMQQKKNRVDSPTVCVAAVQAAVAAAVRAAPGVPIIAGGKSFGGRMTSTAQAESPLPGVRGLVFLGFPLHPPGKPGTARGEHLARVDIPMLFLQGTRDEFAQLDLLQAGVRALGARATLHLVDGGDHSFKVPKRAGKTAADVMDEMARAIAEWCGNLPQTRE